MFHDVLDIRSVVYAREVEIRGLLVRALETISPGRVVKREVMSDLAASLKVTVAGNSYEFSRIFLKWREAVSDPEQSPPEKSASEKLTDRLL